MVATFVVVPQWQGSGSSRAMRLIDGADAIRGDLPSAATRVVAVPMEAGETLDSGVSRFASLLAVRSAQRTALAEVDGPAITIGGDCGVEFGAVEHALDRFGSDTALVWFDAHPDLNTPESSPSGAFHGMVLRALLGDGADGLALSPELALPPERVVLVGTRAADEPEDAFLVEAGVTRLSPGDVADPESAAAAVLAAVRATGATRIYVHVDLDVLDPGEMAGIGYPEPFGLTVPTLVSAITALRADFELVGAGITEFAPSSPDDVSRDMGAILRIISALTR
ncbi:arginase family protein [Microbacteriaceae bacterium 4G12]